MSTDEIVQMMHRHFESLFPRQCSTCGHRFGSLREYILGTQRVAGTISYDAERGDWDTKLPIGAIAHANCTCGTTLALTTEGMPLADVHAVLRWVRAECLALQAPPRVVIESLRDEIRRRALA